ncbi:RICIN domain-containing protein [Brevibacillus fortis]|uniref:Ricin B lectin domain-containing protein n=1 Tax=Brevibacillus fortis TaxID=2126352 RepID=A0A2P7VEH2_9BACL|nr:RICIN domain-containing protein [Brevibacillus fortis]MED1782832.1 RICIN domain-containing protein [Brevibacillus fortis]PSJ97597.1 hypothetical protein C7R93_08190 [Brevibacillus fortis]
MTNIIRENDIKKKRLMRMLSAVMTLLVCMSVLWNGTAANATTQPTVPDSMQPMELGPLMIQTSYNLYLDIWRGEVGDGNKLTLWQNSGGDNQKWKLAVASDGTFQIKSVLNPAYCVDYVWWYDASQAKNRKVTAIKFCSGTANSQKFFIQPTGNSVPGEWDKFVIRSVEADTDCLDVKGGNFSNGEWALIYGCHNPVTENQRWLLVPTGGLGDISSTLRRLADFRALKMYDDSSPRVPSITYTSSTTPQTILSPFKPVSDMTWNGTTSTTDYTINWSTALTSQSTFGVSQSTKITLGTGKDSPVNFQIEQTVGTNWSWMSSTQTSTGGSYKMTIKPSTGGWMIRSQLVNQITGKFTISNDLGTTWTTEEMTSTIPLTDGANNQSSVLVACTTDSTDSKCQNNRPPL